MEDKINVKTEESYTENLVEEPQAEECNLFSNDEKRKFYVFLIDNIIRASDKLYEICLNEPSLCLDTSSLLQNITYDFIALDDWLKLKTFCKELPLPKRRSSTSSFDLFEAGKSKDAPEETEESSDNKKYPKLKQSSNSNIKASDYISSEDQSERRPSVTDQCIQTDWVFQNCLPPPNPREDFIDLQPAENNTFDDNINNLSHIGCSYIAPTEGDYGTTSRENRFVCSFFDTPEGYSRVYNPAFCNPQNMNQLPSNLYSYSPNTIQTNLPYSPHYVPHYHLPYSVLPQDSSPSLRLTHMNLISRSNFVHRTTDRPSARSIRGRRNPRNLENKIPRNKTNKKQRHVDTSENNDSKVFVNDKSIERAEKSYTPVKDNDNIKLERETQDAKEKGSCNPEAVIFPSEEEKCKQSGDSDFINEIPVTEDTFQDKILIKQNIFGLAEDECLEHFPELSSEYQKKSKPKWSILGTMKKTLELKKPSDFYEVIPTSIADENMLERGASFSDIIKVSNQASVEVKKVIPSVMPNNPSSLNHNIGNIDSSLNDPENQVIKLDNHLLTKQTLQPLSICNAGDTLKNDKRGPACNMHFTLGENGLKKTNLEEWLDNQPCLGLLSPQRDENSDSDGWEIVKTRSKWRDTSERNQYNKNIKSTVSPKDNRISYTFLPHVHHGTRFLSSAGSWYNESDENDTTTETTTNSGVLNGFQNENHLPTSLVNKHLKIDNNDELYFENQSYEGFYSSENSYEFSLNQSEATSPEGAKYVDEIDPNEMYSTYMKYLSNVEQHDVDSGSKPNEKILHPESERETSCNPASLEEITDFVNKDPIRALDFKNKLDDRIKHQEDIKKKNEAKQQKAHKKRLQFLQNKRAKFRVLVQKVKEVKAAQDELALQRKKKLDLKLKKAEEKRRMHLNIIKRKAHDEEEKLKEIAFINELEAQNRRHDSLALRQEHEERLQCLVEERQRKLEEKAAKEAAVEERKKALEAERKEKLELMRERRRKKEEFIDRQQQEREKNRLVVAQVKAREREERLQAIHTAQLANAEELQKRIQQKQEESHKRHIECIKLIRQKAIEIGLHKNNVDSSSSQITFKRGTSLKTHNVHDKYKLHLKKRLKKIKSRMVMRGSNFIEETHRIPEDSTHKETILVKIMKKLMICELDKTFIWHDEYIDNVDHCLDDILFYLQEEPNLCDELKDIKAFIYFESVINSFNNSSHEKLSGPTLRCIIKIITICDLSCLESAEVCLYFLLSNILATLLDSLRYSLQALELPSKSWDLIVELLLRFHSLVLEGLNQLPDDMVTTIPDFPTRMKDLLSYILCSGLVNRLVDIVRPSIIDEKTPHDPLLVPTILFFKRLLCSWFISEELTNILKSTDLFGTVPLLYEGLMKHISNDDNLPEYCLPTIKLFLKLAEVDLNVYQEILGADNIALQWRGIASGLMTYCVPNYEFDLLNIVIQLVGYFAIHNKKNQTLLQSGKQPTVLQQLVKLPFKYFCDPEYMELLFPTLISCSFNNATNRAIVENEVSYNGLEKFMNSEVGQDNKIIKLLLQLEENSS